VLAGKDLLGAAQTGTGKTAGFTLPMLQLLAGKSTSSHSPARHPVRCLVLVPTRELAAQVEEAIRTYGKHMKQRTAVVYGGVGFGPQAEQLRRGVDIVVATPGRLLDHVEQRTIDLRAVEILVLDEADRMLDMGFIHDIRRILKLLPAQRQNLLFSATFPEEVRTLASGFMKDAVTVEVARRNLPIELIAQVAHPVDKDRKRELLAHLVKSGNWQQVLVFCRTKHGANRLAEQLEHDGIETAAIHGNKSQPQRMKALKRFKDNELQVLVATDIAARGIDIESLPHVVNYDLPHVPEDYVHRIGRTGRAGESGQAVSLVSGEDRTLLRDIERLIGKQIEQKVIPGFEPGSGYHHAQPEVQQRRGQRPHSQPRRPEKSRSAQRNQGGGQRSQGNGQGRPMRPMQGPRPGNPPRQGQGPRRDHGQGRGPSQGRRQEQRAPITPMDKDLMAVREQQLEYHRKQMAEENRKTGQPANERGNEQPKEKKAGALFGWLGRKVA
jgi:ATP-dependent RNA helicase RhlE